MEGENDAARDAFKKAGREAAFDLAALNLLNGKTAREANLIAESEDAMLRGDSWPELRIRLAELYAASSDNSMALKYLSQAVDLGWRDIGAVTSSPFLKTVVHNEQGKQILMRIERELEAQKTQIDQSKNIQALIQKRF